MMKLPESGCDDSALLQAKGYQARILQHEYDHVIGTLYIDRAIQGTFMERKTPEEAEKDLDIKVGPVKCTHELV